MHELLDEGLTRFSVAIEMDLDPTTVFRHTRGRAVKRARGPKVEELRKRVAWHDKHRRGEISLAAAAEACGYRSNTPYSNAVSIARVVLKRIEAGERQAYPYCGKGPRMREQRRSLENETDAPEITRLTG